MTRTSESEHQEDLVPVLVEMVEMVETVAVDTDTDTEAPATIE